MQFNELAKSLLTKSITSFPETISAPSDSRAGFLSSQNIFWEKIEQLRKYTDSTAERFSKEHQGSTGWEYEMMMVYVDDKFYYSSASTSRDYTKVSSKHSIQIEPDFHSKDMVLVDKILVDDKQVGALTYRGKSEIEKRESKVKNGNYNMGFVSHFHSHPQVQVSGLDKRIYTFFSPTDINSLLHSSTPIMGLVTDRVWLLIKPETNNIVPTAQELHEITRVEANHPDQLESKAAELMNKYNWTLYVGNFKGSFRKITAK